MDLEEMAGILQENITGNISDEGHRRLAFLMHYALLSIDYSSEKGKAARDLIVSDLIIKPKKSHGNCTDYFIGSLSDEQFSLPFVLGGESAVPFSPLEHADIQEIIERIKKQGYAEIGLRGYMSVSVAGFDELCDKFGTERTKELLAYPKSQRVFGYFTRMPVDGFKFSFEDRDIKTYYSVLLPRKMNDIMSKKM
jgi:hypothetical protein